jgi:dihydrofolate reductase
VPLRICVEATLPLATKGRHPYTSQLKWLALESLSPVTKRHSMSTKAEMPSVSFIVARSHPGHLIGCDNKLPWHLRSDLVRFRAITLGHVLIMGRKTYDSIGRVLPGRTNIVLSRKPSERENTMWGLHKTALLWAPDRENSLFLADLVSIARGKKDFFVIGGAEIFERFSDLFNKIYLTEVIGDDIIGDAKFEFEFKYPYWRTIKTQDFPRTEVDDYPSRFSILEKRDKTTRFRMLPDYFTDAASRRNWIKHNLPQLVTENSKSAVQSTPQLDFGTVEMKRR